MISSLFYGVPLNLQSCRSVLSALGGIIVNIYNEKIILFVGYGQANQDS